MASIVLLREIAHGVAPVLQRPSIEILDHFREWSPVGIRRDREVQKLSGAVDRDWTALYGCRPAVVIVTELAPPRFPIADRPSKGVPVGTKTITMYVSDLDQSEIPTGQVYQLSIRHPDGATQQLDISEKNYRALKLQKMGKTLKKRGRKPGSTTKATKAASTPPTRRRRQNNKRPATA
jgi:hypothetical protein